MPGRTGWRVRSVAGCPEFTDQGGRCEGHRQEAEQRRGSSLQRGYGRDHTIRFRPGVRDRVCPAPNAPSCHKRVNRAAVDQLGAALARYGEASTAPALDLFLRLFYGPTRSLPPPRSVPHTATCRVQAPAPNPTQCCLWQLEPRRCGFGLPIGNSWKYCDKRNFLRRSQYVLDR